MSRRLQCRYTSIPDRNRVYMSSKWVSTTGRCVRKPSRKTCEWIACPSMHCSVGLRRDCRVRPGVSILSLSDRAVQTIKSRKTDVDSYYMDINWLAKAWGLDSDNKFIYHYTPALSLIYVLREALSLVAEEGLQNVIERYERNSRLFQNHINSLGLRFLVPISEHRLHVILSV